jgi:hypothetical protein
MDPAWRTYSAALVVTDSVDTRQMLLGYLPVLQGALASSCWQSSRHGFALTRWTGAAHYQRGLPFRHFENRRY